MTWIDTLLFMIASFMTGWLLCKDFYNLWKGEET